MADKKSLNTLIKNIFLTGLAGWIVSLYTLWHRSKVQAGVGLGESFCNVSSDINCDAVALSAYSQFLGIPVSIFGMIFFSVVIVLALKILQQNKNSRIGAGQFGLLWISAWAGAAASIILGLVSVFKIGSFCLVCGIIYLLCLSLLFLVWRLKKKISLHPEKLATSFYITLTIVAASQMLFSPLSDFAATGGQSASSSRQSIPAEILSQVLREYNQESAYEIPVQNSPVVGPANPEFTLVEFSDFECPHCAQNHKRMPESIRHLSSKVRIIYKNYPLDPSCNTGGRNRKSCFAARSARCALNLKGLEAFLRLKNYLYTEAEFFTLSTVKEEAKKLGISNAEFDQCVESPETHKQIADEIALAQSIGVDGTPAIFLNGKRVRMGASPGILPALIESL